jgi:tetratricopeptide (TPR) repeat protein
MKNILLALALLFSGVLYAQDEQLARQYLENGEYEKAASLYEQLYKKFPQQEYFLTQYASALIANKDFAKAETEIKKQLKSRPDNLTLQLTLGDIYTKQEKAEDAKKQYQKAISSLKPDPNQVLMLKDAFMTRYQTEYALQTLERGNALLKEKNHFAFYEGDVLRSLNEPTKMVTRYLDAMEFNEGILPSLEATFQRYFKDEDYKELVAQLYTRLQAQPDKIPFTELLISVLQQRKEFKAALKQVRALDRRLEESGTRVFTFARNIENENDYDTAIDAYTYVKEQGNTSPFFVEANKGMLRCRREKIVRGFNYTKAEVNTLANEYGIFLQQNGWNVNNSEMIREWAKLEVFYNNNLDKGVVLMDSLLKMPRLPNKIAGESKLELGDYYLMQSEPWEATLLYSQVDKAFKEDDLGEMGRYKNAKLSYYSGDFEWAQSQLKVLKASTSELISNDAIDLSVFIMDNLNLDTAATAMKMYATADLLAFQNRFDEAFLKLDSMPILFPKHALEDDIWYAKAQIYKKQRNYTEAAVNFQKIMDTYPEEIRADNATFELAELNELHLNNKDAALKLYEKIITTYTSSTFIIEARKRFRALRGEGKAG